MNDEKDDLYLISMKSLDRILREIVQSEFKILEEKLRKEPKVLTREEAAEFLNVCPNTISEYVNKGHIPNRGIGRKIMILETDLMKVSKKRRYTHWN
jgi:excisionase family DNA binding protein